VIFGLLPVKAPGRAKQRLAGLLSAGEREALAGLMYQQVLEALCAARGIDRVAVVTSDGPTADHARRSGAMVFEEAEQLSHSRSADAAARQALELGAATVVLLPIDTPLVTPGEIEGLLAEAPRPGVAIVPNSDGSGTNALVRTPPDAIESRFGPGSFEVHVRQARELGLPLTVACPAGLVFDVDTPEDIAELLRRAPQSPVAQLLRTQCALKS
jgi:2-phospho-L-lactate guanylyltransferase